MVKMNLSNDDFRNGAYNKLSREFDDIYKNSFDDLSDPDVYKRHSQFLYDCANFVLAREGKTFIVDDSNKDILRFLLYYFNNCPLALEVYPDEDYNLYKNILIWGDVGVGKTMIMQIFSEYLKRTKNPNAFYNLSVSQMVNYYKLHNNLDKYTFNETDNNKNFEGNPFGVCLNDIGIENSKFFGIDTKTLISDFIYSRTEILQQQGIKAHLTSNKNYQELAMYLEDDDSYGRLADRLKYYNIIKLDGDNKRA